MPIVLRRGQYRFGFYASDRNEPPHVHVRKNGHQAKFWLVPVIELEKNEGLRPHELNEAERIITPRNASSCWRNGMASSAVDTENALDVQATSVTVTDETITVELEDGRTISVPTVWFPRLKLATPQERANYEIEPFGVVWPDVEADFSIRGLLLGRKSGESPECFKFWLDNRKKGRKVTFEDYMKERRKSSVRKKSKK